jgi:hypothetical protein
MSDQQSSSVPSSAPARPKWEEAYVGKPPAYFLSTIFNRFLIVYAAIIVLVRVAGSNGFQIVPRILEPAAINVVSFVFPAFRYQFQQLAVLADGSVQRQYLAVIFLTISVSFGVTIYSVAKYSKVWRQLAAPNWSFYFTAVVTPPIFFWMLTYEKFKPTMESLTVLFFDRDFGWFYIRQVGVVIAEQVLVAAIILSITQLILMRVKLPKDAQ